MKKVQRRFKIRGFTLKVEALDEVLSFLSRFQDAEDEALDLLIDELEKESRIQSTEWCLCCWRPNRRR
ncbi:hypothetical protein QJS10_CPA06g02229 [Acorus calamus]|uniref:Uncharacterized protein n=1 Tax=Acorus calamus TaxID=4465 RepID=A0AAV9ENF9_ACOCL|nr:hypothetical protein QJS10_CPA06g02229 [Acorus calamus]